MLKASHTTLIVLSGLIWFAIGCFLLPLGLNFVVESILNENLITKHRPILDHLAPYIGGIDTAALIFIAFCLLVGYLKGRYVFSKTVQRGVERILMLPNPTSLANIYTKKYYLLLGSMVFLGVLVRLTTLDIRGGVDIIIGSALINGAILYFRCALQERRKTRQLENSFKA